MEILNWRRNKILKVILLAVAIILIVIWAKNSLPIFKGKTQPSTGTAQVVIKGAKDKVNINKQFEFPLKNTKGEEVSKIKYTVESAELRDEILIKGKRASAVSGRQFLIINVKIANEFGKSFEINSKDYVRVVVEAKEAELLAADIHNDSVKVQPISTKYTRLGFPVNDADKNFKLKVGEINGEKIDIEIKFK